MGANLCGLSRLCMGLGLIEDSFMQGDARAHTTLPGSVKCDRLDAGRMREWDSTRRVTQHVRHWSGVPEGGGGSRCTSCIGSR